MFDKNQRKTVSAQYTNSRELSKNRQSSVVIPDTWNYVSYMNTNDIILVICLFCSCTRLLFRLLEQRKANKFIINNRSDQSNTRHDQQKQQKQQRPLLQLRRNVKCQTVELVVCGIWFVWNTQTEI